MRKLSGILKWLLLLPVLVVVVHDLAVDTCSRWIPKAAYYISDDAGYRLRSAETSLSVRLFQADDLTSFEVPGISYPADQLSGQFGGVSVLPEWSLAVVSMVPMWQGDEQDFFAKFARRNNAHEVARARIPRFVMVQTGGGVEGLAEQIVLTESEHLSYWLIGEDDEHDGLLGEPAVYRIGEDHVAKIFSLADGSRLASQRKVRGHCDLIDGGFLGIVYYDGDSVGRMQFLNREQPHGKVGTLVDLLRRSVASAYFEGRFGELATPNGADNPKTFRKD